MNKLPENPVINDLILFSTLKHKRKWLRNHRLNKKFRKHWHCYVSQEIFNEFMGKLLTMPIRRTIDYAGAFRRAVIVEPLGLHENLVMEQHDN